jgi:hypothetical protein
VTPTSLPSPTRRFARSLTADAPKWREPATVLDDPLHIIEIDEPPED